MTCREISPEFFEKFNRGQEILRKGAEERALEQAERNERRRRGEIPDDEFTIGDLMSMEPGDALPILMRMFEAKR